MRFDSTQQLDSLKAILAISRQLNIDALVITGGRVGGASADRQVAIISDVDLGIKKEIKLGIGRISELEKRLALFGGEVTIEGKVNDNSDVVMLTIAEGRSKMQYRCTAEKLIRYPKSNEDPAALVVTLTRSEAVQLVKAIKTLGAETTVLKVGRDRTAGFEASDATNEQFAINLETKAEFVDEVDSTVITYKASNFTSLVELVGRGADKVELVIGEGGSITAVASGFSVVMMPYVSEDSE